MILRRFGHCASWSLTASGDVDLRPERAPWLGGAGSTVGQRVGGVRRYRW